MRRERELRGAALVVRPVHHWCRDHGPGSRTGSFSTASALGPRTRAAPAAAIAAVLLGPRRLARGGRLADRLLVIGLLLRSHDRARTHCVRRAGTDRGGRTMD